VNVYYNIAKPGALLPGTSIVGKVSLVYLSMPKTWSKSIYWIDGWMGGWMSGLVSGCMMSYHGFMRFKTDLVSL
jgi:hypothetical protein